MNDDFLMLNIREYLKQSEYGENILKQVFSTFSCDKNLDVERFLLEQAISFTKKNQSVTYIVLTPEEGEVLGYFTITLAPAYAFPLLVPVFSLVSYGTITCPVIVTVPLLPVAVLSADALILPNGIVVAIINAIINHAAILFPFVAAELILS